MTAATSEQKPDSSPAPAPAIPSEEHLLSFWEKHGQNVMTVCACILLAIVVRGGWGYFSELRERGVEKDFLAATTPEKLKAFAAGHAGHELAGVALLRVADAAYAAEQGKDAVADYALAVDTLKSGPLAARAHLGLAMAKLQAGQTSDGEADLQKLSNDPSGFTAIRAEATYQLASLAAGAGRAAEVQKLAGQLMQIDPSSLWAQRAFALEAETPVSPSKAPDGATEGPPLSPGSVIKPPSPASPGPLIQLPSAGGK